jgi:ankyrin repeat protein
VDTGRLVLALACGLFAGQVAAADAGAQFAVAIERGDQAAVTALLDSGFAADTPIGEGEGRTTPLQKAAWNGRTEIAKLLIAHGASVNDSAPTGSALNNAVSRGWDDMVTLLLESGADPNQRDARDNTPLGLAVSAGHQEIAAMLIKEGADLTASTFGLTPLMFAASSGDLEMMRFLVKAGAKVNTAGKGQYGGRTPLLAAITAGQADAVKLLIELKADVNLKGPGGETPLKAARDAGQEEIVSILQKAGAREGGAAPLKKP